MEIIQTIATLLPLSLTSGVNLYATVLTVGICIRFQLIEGIPHSLDLLSAWPILIFSGVLFLIETLAGVVPWADYLSSIVNALLKPLGMGVIGLFFVGDASPMMILLTVLAVGSITTVANGGQAGGRLALNIFSPGEKFTNFGLGAGESAFSVALTFLTLKYPYVASGIAIIALILIIIVTPQLMRWSFFTMSSVLAKIKSFFSKATVSDTLPTEYWQAMAHRVPEMTVRCRVQGIRGANGRNGYIAKYGPNLVFAYKRFFSTHIWRVNTRQLLAGHLASGSFMDVIGLRYLDKENKKQVVRFVFLKDRSMLAQSFLDALKKSRDEQRAKFNNIAPG
jgi:hypothetical protein